MNRTFARTRDVRRTMKRVCIREFHQRRLFRKVAFYLEINEAFAKLAVLISF